MGDPRQPRRAEGDRPARRRSRTRWRSRCAPTARSARRSSQAEGQKQSPILTAEGEKQAAVLRAEGQRQATILEAEGQAKAIDTVFSAIHEGNPDPQLLAYQYLQTLPQIAQGESNKVWIIPAEFQQALGKIGGVLGAGSETRRQRDRTS